MRSRKKRAIAANLRDYDAEHQGEFTDDQLAVLKDALSVYVEMFDFVLEDFEVQRRDYTNDSKNTIGDS